VAATYDGERATVFVDGVNTTSDANTTTAAAYMGVFPWYCDAASVELSFVLQPGCVQFRVCLPYSEQARNTRQSVQSRVCLPYSEQARNTRQSVPSRVCLPYSEQARNTRQSVPSRVCLPYSEQA
jgi:hypothetical protein